jgi:hypothetical protein
MRRCRFYAGVDIVRESNRQRSPRIPALRKRRPTAPRYRTQQDELGSRGAPSARPAASMPCTWNTDLATSRPIVVIDRASVPRRVWQTLYHGSNAISGLPTRRSPFVPTACTKLRIARSALFSCPKSILFLWVTVPHRVRSPAYRQPPHCIVGCNERDTIVLRVERYASAAL